MKDSQILLRFSNTEGQLTTWPAKRSNQQVILAYLASKFVADRTYSEREVNEILNQWHTFGDWAILRRALIDDGYMQRNRDSSEYRLYS